MTVYTLPIGERDRAAFRDLCGSGFATEDACDLIAVLNCFRSDRARLRTAQIAFMRHGLTAACAHSWLLARGYLASAVAPRRPRRSARWGHVDSRGAQ